MSDYELGEIGRQVANLLRVGKITELDQVNARVKVSTAGLTTDWLPWGAARAGNTRTWSPPRIGEQVIIASPYGDMAQGVVIGSLFQDDRPAPAASQDQETTVYPDGTVVDYNSATHQLLWDLGPTKITANRTALVLECNGSKITMDASGIKLEGARIDLN